MAIFHGNAIPSTSSDYNIPYSCRFDLASSSRMTRTFNHSTSYTTSCWVKRSNLVDNVGATIQYVYRFGAEDHMGFGTADKLQVERYTGINAYTNRYMRDPAAWYHIHIKASTNNFEVFVNGVAHDKTDGGTYGNNTGSGTARTSQAFQLGMGEATNKFFDGYIAEFHFCDGIALDPTSFGEFGSTYGEWKPIEYENDGATSHGSNGWHLDFADSAALGNDVSGNNNDLTPTNLAAHDQMLDTPTNNFQTANSLDRAGSAYVFKQGNLHVTRTGGDGFVGGTMAVNSGKWYFELLMASSVSNYPRVGIWDRENGNDAQDINYPNEVDGTSASRSWGANGSRHGPGVAAGSAPTYTNADILQFAIDIDNQKLHFGKNNTWYSTGTTTVTSAAIADNSAAGSFADLTAGSYWEPVIFSNNNADNWFLNCGQDATFAGNKSPSPTYDDGDYGVFHYEPPSGFKAICTKNLTACAVVPSEHFNVVLHAGTGSSQTITGVGFQPDLVWVKARAGTYGDYNHNLFDALRGVTKSLTSNAADAEITLGTKLTAFNADGWVGGGDNETNNASTTYVSWNWKANGAGSSNENGSINTTATSANVAAGFSISKFTGTGSNATVGHGLSQKPEIVVIKNINTAAKSWVFGSKQPLYTMDFTDHMFWDTAISTTDYANYWQDTEPNATVVTIGDADYVNGSGVAHIMYCWHSVNGYSRIGAYRGNGDNHGRFIYTGFRPKYILAKVMSAADSWQIMDTARDPYNVANKRLRPDAYTGENLASWTNVDFLSNGFKLRGTDTIWNHASHYYIYMSFAETPFKNANAR